MAIKIYALMDGITCLYVGKTKNSLLRRASGHRHKKSKCYTKYIPDDIKWTIELIEECDNSIGRLREQYWYDTLEPLYNDRRPGQTGAEWYQKNKDRVISNSQKENRKETRHLWYQKNKAYVIKRNNEYKKAKKAQILQEYPAYSLLHQS
jgi:hypothetical protein